MRAASDRSPGTFVRSFVPRSPAAIVRSFVLFVRSPHSTGSLSNPRPPPPLRLLPLATCSAAPYPCAGASSSPPPSPAPLPRQTDPHRWRHHCIVCKPAPLLERGPPRRRGSVPTARSPRRPHNRATPVIFIRLTRLVET